MSKWFASAQELSSSESEDSSDEDVKKVPQSSS